VVERRRREDRGAERGGVRGGVSLHAGEGSYDRDVPFPKKIDFFSYGNGAF
jgi:hypothetical protein